MAKSRKQSKSSKRLPALRRRKNFIFLLPALPIVIPSVVALGAGALGVWAVSKWTKATTSSAMGLAVPTVVGGASGYLAARLFKLDRTIALAATLGTAGLGYLSAKGIQKLKEMKEEQEQAAWCTAHPWRAMLPGSGCP